MSAKKKTIPSSEQLSFFSDEGAMAPKSEKKSEKKPATLLMKKVAEETMNIPELKKNFSKEDAQEIIMKVVQASEKEQKQKIEEAKESKKKIKSNKRTVLEMEAGNRDRLIMYPSDKEGHFYKLLEVSALYYSYKLADLMGRKGRIMVDSDRFYHADYVASLTNIEKFVEQFKELEGGEPEITLTGIYIFPLKKPLTDDEIGHFKQIENTRRDKMHSLLEPKKMNPALYQLILMLMRQLSPKVAKLDPGHYRILGEDMMRDLRDILAIYNDYANGVKTEIKSGQLMMKKIGRLKASLTMLGETRVWGFLAVAPIAENLVNLESLTKREFKASKK